MFFHFQLNPIAEIRPWGKKDEPTLHWFGLSDGRYWIQIDEIELFRYSNALLDARLSEDPTLAAHPLLPYVDYFVIRLWEDILEILPTIIDPLPAPLLQRIEPIDEWLQWSKKADSWRWQEDVPEEEMCSEEMSEVRSEMHEEALSWWWNRNMYTGPISSPGLHFWSDGRFVHCSWDSRDRLHENKIPIWEAVYGNAVIPMNIFMEAVTSFNTRFIAAMAERVEPVLANWSRPEIKIDFAQLAREQVQRSEHFAKRMGEVPTRAKTAAQWESVLAAISAIDNDPDFLAMP